MTKVLIKKPHTVCRIIWKAVIYLFFVLMTVIMLLPFYWSLIASIRPETENQMGFSLIPKTFTLSQYSTFFKRVADVGAGISLAQIFGNTFFIVACVIFLSLLTCALAAYALTHLHLPGEKIILKIMTASMMLPGIVTLIPSFLVVDFLGLKTKYAAFCKCCATPMQVRFVCTRGSTATIHANIRVHGLLGRIPCLRFYFMKRQRYYLNVVFEVCKYKAGHRFANAVF